MKKTINEEKERIIRIMEQSQLNEMGFDTPVTVNDEVIVILKSLIGSPEFLQKVIDHVGGARRGITPERFGKSMQPIIDRRLKEIIREIPKIPEFGMRGYKPLESDKYHSPEEEPEETDEYNETYNKNMTQGFSSINESNAFIGAAKKAKKEGKDTFELGGKKYKVTLKENKK